MSTEVGELGKKVCKVVAKVAREEDKVTPPLKDWKFFTGGRGGRWEFDPTFEWSREVALPCTEVRVELRGGAKEKYPGLEGSYLPVEDKVIRGRWVGSYQQQSFAVNNCHWSNFHTCVFDKY